MSWAAAVVLAAYQLAIWRWDLWWRPVVLLDFDPGAAFLDASANGGRWTLAATPEDALVKVKEYLADLGRN